MRVLKERGDYLDRGARVNLIGLIITFVLGVFLALFVRGWLLLLPLLLILPLACDFCRGYSNYKKGVKGEEAVIEALSCLSNDYYLINDIKLPNLKGNIDHLLIGPNGIWVLETKNYSGKIECRGDLWWIVGKRKKKEISSPSKQVKRNTVALKRTLEYFLGRKLGWIEGIVVFTDPNVELALNNPTVTILKAWELSSYIKNKKLNNFSPEALDQIVQAVLKICKDL